MNFMKKALLPTLLTALIAGCGSDDDSTVEQPVQPIKETKPEYLDVDVNPNSINQGHIKVMLGEYDDNIKTWLLSDSAKDLDDDGKIGILDAHIAGVYNDEKTIYSISLTDIGEVLASNPDGLGAGTARPDIFKPGHYSAFDLLRYLSFTRDDLTLSNVVHHENTGLGTFTFNVSMDVNGDGILSANDGDIVDSDDWYFRFNTDGGIFTRARGSMQGFSPSGEATYVRIDEYWLQQDSLITLQPFSNEMTARRQWIQRQEVEKFQANGNKVIIPKVVAVEYGRVENNGVVAYADNIEVTPVGHRDDIFQPGVITVMDAMIAAQDKLGKVSFSYWDSLSTGADVGHFALSGIGELRNSGLRGWFTHFYNPSKQFPDGDFNKSPTCNWSIDGSPDGETRVSKEVCEKDWGGPFGGEHIHLMQDVYPIRFGYMDLYWAYGNMHDYFGPKERNGQETIQWNFANDSSPDISVVRTLQLPKDATGSAPILNQDHFGWKIADCTQCHNQEVNPLGHGGHAWPINSSDGFDITQPYYCASCHGSNGAPKAHGEDARCFFCHAGEKQPQSHNDASTKILYKGADKLKANSSYGNFDPFQAVPADVFGNHKPYTEVWESKNNDWEMSKVFPDPYACLTCHINKK
ncbi:hypothetical protein EKG38_16505 [Shewanella canadensis]|uniref:Uncharacterized protein n=1 Tax=Shewanella canadensis TaxID=271096 RepID=A0A431WRQ1_9GAMM|nr:hypothetical protein [Shewanella canadensis]RTR37885.1 hypothetical protein EKG38_16505 [Shewanella canadensis]